MKGSCIPMVRESRKLQVEVLSVLAERELIATYRCKLRRSLVLVNMHLEDVKHHGRPSMLYA